MHSNNIRRTASLTMALGLLASLSVQADPTITLVGQTQLGNGAVAPGTQYDFFGTGGQPIFHPDYDITVVAPGTRYYGNGTTETGFPAGTYSTLIAPGTSSVFQTGLLWAGGIYNQSAPLVTFTSSLSDFHVWLLDANTDAYAVGNASISLSSGSAFASASTFANQYNYTGGPGINEFTEFSISGASTTDVFTVSATPWAGKPFNNGTLDNQPSVGGLTFSAPVPEPTSLALVGLGGLCLAARHWRNRQA